MTARITETMALAAVVAGATGMGATAHAIEGSYGRVDAGYSFEGDVERNAGPGAFDLDENWVESLGMGYAFGSGLRIEGEFSHRYNEIAPVAGVVDEGDIHAWSAMGNVYYDFNKQGAVQPYVGLGAGVTRLNLGLHNAVPFADYDDDDVAVAYQGMAGVGFQVSERLSFDVGYRYFMAQSAKFSGAPAALGADYTNQAATVGLRWQFGEREEAPPPPPPPPPAEYAPPPPPMAAPVACPTMEFVVYFEWDRSNVNDAAFDNIDAAINQARQCNLAGVTVVGHTDTSGSAEYNRGLSERRASAVRDAMVARGLNAFAIRTEGRGETDLQRPTRDGVREPLNRRATVTLTFQ